jgi:flagellar motor switch protein FliM
MSDETKTNGEDIDELLGPEEGAETPDVEVGEEGLPPAVQNLVQTDTRAPFPGTESFDFSLAHTISRQFEKNLLKMCESFAKSVSLALTRNLRANTAIRFTKVDLISYGAFSADLAEMTAVSIVTLAPLSGFSLIHFDLNMAYLMIMRLLGGPIEDVSIDRKFSDIELGIAKMITEQVNSDLKDAASKLVELRPEFIHLENNPNYLGIVATNDPVVVLNFDISIEELQGPLRICIPMASFEPVWDKFDPEENSEYRSPAEVKRDRLMVYEAVKGSKADMVVNLAEIDLTFQHILELSEGDTLNLGKSVNTPLVLTVQGKPMFKGLPGKMNLNSALKLTERLEEED